MNTFKSYERQIKRFLKKKEELTLVIIAGLVLLAIILLGLYYYEKSYDLSNENVILKSQVHKLENQVNDLAFENAKMALKLSAK